MRSKFYIIFLLAGIITMNLNGACQMLCSPGHGGNHTGAAVADGAGASVCAHKKVRQSVSSLICHVSGPDEAAADTVVASEGTGGGLPLIKCNCHEERTQSAVQALVAWGPVSVAEYRRLQLGSVQVAEPAFSPPEPVPPESPPRIS